MSLYNSCKRAGSTPNANAKLMMVAHQGATQLRERCLLDGTEQPDRCRGTRVLVHLLDHRHVDAKERVTHARGQPSLQKAAHTDFDGGRQLRVSVLRRSGADRP